MPVCKSKIIVLFFSFCISYFFLQLLDVIALHICLEALEPSQEMLLSPETRRTWCDRVLSIRPAVEDMIRKERFGPVREKCSNYGERSTVMLGHCR